MKAFGSILNRFLKLVMGLADKIKPQVPQNIENPAPQNELNVKELEFLLVLIKNTTFKGEDVEVVYNTTLKLQNQYLQQTQK